MTSTAFARWIDTFVDEKGLDREHRFEIDTDDFWGHHSIPLGVVVDAAKSAQAFEQDQIKKMFVTIDFKNGDVLHFFEHLARGLIEAMAA